MQNYYQLLNIKPTAAGADLKEALRNALRLWTNRTNSPQMERRQEAERMVKLIEEAEEVLLNPAKRTEYERKLKSTPVDDSPPAANTLEGQDLVALGRRLLSNGEIGDALYVATKATEKDGGNPEAWALLGEARFQFGDVEDAIYEYKRAIKLKPNDPFYYSELGDIYNSADKLDDALAQYERASRVAPSVPMFRAGFARILLRQGKSAAALPILEQCVKEESNNDYFQWELAIAYIDGAQNSWTYVPEGSHLAAGYYATSKTQVIEALQYVAKAERLKFDDAELREHIARVKADVTRNLKRRYFGSTVAAVVGGILWSCAYGLGLIFAPLYFYASRPPQYALNKRVLSGQVAGSDKVMAAAGKVVNVVQANEAVAGGVGLAVVVMTGFFLPIMTIWNYVKNYTGENNVSDVTASLNAPVPPAVAAAAAAPLEIPPALPQ